MDIFEYFSNLNRLDFSLLENLNPFSNCNYDDLVGDVYNY